MTTDRLYEPRAVREGMGWDTVAYLLELDQVGRSVREGEGYSRHGCGGGGDGGGGGKRRMTMTSVECAVV